MGQQGDQPRSGKPAVRLSEFSRASSAEQVRQGEFSAQKDRAPVANSIRGDRGHGQKFFRILPGEVCECLVGVGHSVDVLTFGDRSTFFVVGSD